LANGYSLCACRVVDYEALRVRHLTPDTAKRTALLRKESVRGMFTPRGDSKGNKLDNGRFRKSPLEGNLGTVAFVSKA